MKLREFGLITDENVDRGVVAWLRSIGFDVIEQNLCGCADSALLQLSVSQNRIVLTHDSDFGTLSVLRNEPVVGILYIRPGHLDAQFIIEILLEVLAMDPEVIPPFLVVARRSGSAVTLRIRRLRS